jgi:hypothetical protein
MAPTAQARARRRTRPADVTHNLVAVAAKASTARGSSGAIQFGHPAASASPVSPENDVTAAPEAEIARPKITSQSR